MTGEKLKLGEEYRLHRQNRLKPRKAKERNKKKVTENSNSLAAVTSRKLFLFLNLMLD